MRSTMISRCSSPIPERMVCPVSGSVFTRNVGSSWASLCDRHAHLFLIGLGLRLDGQLNHRRREIDRFERDRMLFIADRVARRNGLQTHRRADIARHDLLNVFALVGVHAQQPAHALLAALGDVVDRFARVHLARVNPEERQLTRVRVGHDLENQRRERLAVGSLAVQLDVLVVDRRAFDIRNIERRRQVIHHRVEHRLHALVLECRPADHRENLHRDGRLADAGLDFRRPSAAAPSTNFSNSLSSNSETASIICSR